MVDGKQNPHAVFIPYPLQGHVIPAVHLAKKLASMGFTITFVNTEFIHNQITKSCKDNNNNNINIGCDDIFSKARKSGLDVRYATISDGLPLGFDRSLNHDQYMEGILHVLSAHVDQFLWELLNNNDSQPKVSLLIADTFFVWTSNIANKYHLLNVSFWTEPALVLNLYYHLDLLKNNRHFASQDNREDTIDYVPGVRAIEPNDVMSYLQPSTKDTSTVVHQIIYKAFKDIRNVDFILVNSVEELEKECILALDHNKPTYAIGPIFSTGFMNESVPTSLWTECDCTEWLQKKPPSSVLYVSFGSYAHTSKQVLHAIAHGLINCDINFIWVVRPDIVSSDDPNPLPDGFVDIVANKGLVVTWCNQTKVLSHESVGGFLTHCGWNSILESTWCAVPLLCFPLLTDQFTNRKLVVDDWKIGINLCDKNTLNQAEVSEKVNCLMRGKSAQQLTERIKKVKKTMEDAWADGGSSLRNFDRFNTNIRTKLG